MNQQTTADPYALAGEAAARLAELTGVGRHDVALVLGSGWLPAADLLGETVAEVDVTDLPGFDAAAVVGHVGRVRSVRAGDLRALVFLSRTHYYEGKGVAAVVHGVRTAARAGCHTMVLTNGCGGLKESWTPGTPVLISDHINLTGRSPIVGAHFVDLTDLYSRRLRALCREVDPSLDEGVYVQFPGPHYETPAEVRMAGIIGGHLVGMSTTLEAIAAREAGMEVLGISLVTNLAAGIGDQPLDHAEVLAAGAAAAERMGGLLARLVPRLGATRVSERRPVRVLVTGAAGSIGRVVTLGLTDRGHEVVALDRVPPYDGSTLSWHTVDCTDPDAVAAVLAEEAGERSLDAVVHLAGNPGEAALPDELASHVVSTAALLDAMVDHGVRRMVYASSDHAVGRTPRADLPDGVLTVDDPPRPDTFHGVAKVAAEALLRLYADRHDLDAVACRIGSFLPEPRSVRALATWLSHDDCVRMVEAALTTPAPGFAVLHGISANTRAWWDLDPGRALGYDPQDDAERWVDQVDPGPDDGEEARWVGGSFATGALGRPAFDRP